MYLEIEEPLIVCVRVLLRGFQLQLYLISVSAKVYSWNLENIRTLRSTFKEEDGKQKSTGI